MKHVFCAALLVCALAAADEGMWTYDNFPSQKVQKAYGFSPSAEWLENARLSSVRLAGGCSGSFVSPNGLVMTNHHCAHQCIEQLSTAKRDYVKTGFNAKTAQDEVKCPTIEINQLTDISDVTDRVTQATQGLSGKAFADKRKEISAQLEKACTGGDADKVRCDVVSLYHNGKYNLYKYRRYQDVRLAFAPEFDIAFFGGDPDNFMFPRYDLDVSFLRIYENGQPAKTDHYFRWSADGAKDGELTFVSGHPGGTERDLTVAELQYQRDVALPERIWNLAQYRGMLSEFQRRGPEQKRISNADLFYVENSYKALKGRYEALTDADFFATKVAVEKDLRNKVNADPAKKAAYGDAWDQVQVAVKESKVIRKPLQYLEQGRGFSSTLFSIARNLVRAPVELAKADTVRLKEYTDAQLPVLKQHLFSKEPIYPELETQDLAYSLTRLREELGADDPVVKKVLGKKSPRDLATELVKGTQLMQLAVREQLWKGGQAALDASHDPMIALAKLVDPDARAVRKHYEDDIQSVMTQASEKIARARFAVYGTSVYPDATFTLRLSYGQVKGWQEGQNLVKPFTTVAGAFTRATGSDPFKLPQSWIKAQAKLNPDTKFDFVTNNDIIGGNSGSPMFNKDAEIVGLVFDGNIESLGGDYGFDEKVNRTVAVHSSALIEAMDKVYGATRIVSELRPAAGHGDGGR